MNEALRGEEVAGARPEPIFARGPTEGPQILIVQPLFAERNRTRILIGDVMRRLAAHGIGCWLPELPGEGESATLLEQTSWAAWRAAVAAAADHVAARSGSVPFVASLRGGALLDDAAAARGWWRLAPTGGAALLRDVMRAQLMADREAGRGGSLASLDAAALAGPVSLAGMTLTPPLYAGLRDAVPAEVQPLRIVRFEGDGGNASDRLAGEALWRRAEPGRSADTADLIAADIRSWIETCGAT
ncbi:hypothetical protein ABC347_04850 [Sphingomonas sp. 1P06PA]|uniref:hypothetical protein n=1 Tax=Sphingomonas sp. 1P06PA TaxID=554121 RepID=UPI0039A49C54